MSNDIDNDYFCDGITEEKNLLFNLINEKDAEITNENISKWFKGGNEVIMLVPYDSGFNSKSVFNTYSKKKEGINPSQWFKFNSN